MNISRNNNIKISNAEKMDQLNVTVIGVQITVLFLVPARGAHTSKCGLFQRGFKRLT